MVSNMLLCFEDLKQFAYWLGRAVLERPFTAALCYIGSILYECKSKPCIIMPDGVDFCTRGSRL